MGLPDFDGNNHALRKTLHRFYTAKKCSVEAVIEIAKSADPLAPEGTPEHQIAVLLSALGFAQDSVAELEEEIERYQLRTMPYREYLKTDWWDYVRTRAIQAAGGKCQLCNSNKSLQVHHRTYERRGSEDPEDVIALCSGCHAKFHDRLARWGSR